MNDPNQSTPSDEQLLATLRAVTQNGPQSTRTEPETSADEPSLREAYAGFAKAVSALAQPIDAQAIVQSVLGGVAQSEAPSVDDDSPVPAKLETIESSPATRRQRFWAKRFWANPWSYAAVASIVAVAGLTWIENFSSDRGKKVEAGELAQWNGYAQIDEKLDRSTDELVRIEHVPDFVTDTRLLDERIDDAEADMDALLNDMGLVPL